VDLGKGNIFLIRKLVKSESPKKNKKNVYHKKSLYSSSAYNYFTIIIVNI